MSDPQQFQVLPPTRLFHTWNFPGKSTGVGCYCPLQGVSNSENSHKGNLLNTRPNITQLTVAPCIGSLIYTTNKTKIQTQSSVDRSTTSFSLAHQRQNKQTNKNSAQISPYMKLTHTTRPTFSSVQFSRSVVSDSL